MGMFSVYLNCPLPRLLRHYLCFAMPGKSDNLLKQVWFSSACEFIHWRLAPEKIFTSERFACTISICLSQPVTHTLT